MTANRCWRCKDAYASCAHMGGQCETGPEPIQPEPAWLAAGERAHGHANAIRVVFIVLVIGAVLGIWSWRML